MLIVENSSISIALSVVDTLTFSSAETLNVKKNAQFSRQKEFLNVCTIKLILCVYKAFFLVMIAMFAKANKGTFCDIFDN